MNDKFLWTRKLKTMMSICNKLDNGAFVFCYETDRFYIKMHDQLIGIAPKRRGIIEFKCLNCGAPISGSSIVKCDYCDSVFDIDHWSTNVK